MKVGRPMFLFFWSFNLRFFRVVSHNFGKRQVMCPKAAKCLSSSISYFIISSGSLHDTSTSSLQSKNRSLKT